MRLAPALVVLILTGSAGLAGAQGTSWHVTGTGDVAATDNVFAAPNDGNREADVFFSLRPGTVFTYNAPRMIHELNAGAEIIEYTLHSDRPSVSVRGGWHGFYLPGPRSELNTSLNAGTGVVTAISASQSPDQTAAQITPTGDVTVVSADAGQSLSWLATQEVRLTQSLFGRWSQTDDNAEMSTITSSAEAGGAVSIERSWLKDSITVEIAAAAQRLEANGPDTGVPGSGSRLDRQIVPRARAQWRHDLNQRYSFTLDGGVQYLYPYGVDENHPDQFRSSGVFPTAGGSLALTEVWGRAQLTARRDIAPNLLIAQNTVNDAVGINVTMPLPWFDDSRMRAPKWLGSGSIGAQRTQLVDSVTADLKSSLVAARVDLGVVYAPRPGFNYTLRYELVYQTGDATAEMPIQGYWRNTLSFGFAFRYPNDLAGQIPKRRGSSTRADGKDLVPVGVEPVVPEAPGGGD